MLNLIQYFLIFKQWKNVVQVAAELPHTQKIIRKVSEIGSCDIETLWENHPFPCSVNMLEKAALAPDARVSPHYLGSTSLGRWDICRLEQRMTLGLGGPFCFIS